MTAYEVLVILLSLFLGIFLILAIVIAVSVMKLLKKVHSVADKATHTINSVEGLADTFRSVTNASALGTMAAKLFKRFYKSQSKKR